MRYHKLGRTGLLVSEICLGTMTFGGNGFWTAIGRQSQDEANTLVQRAFDGGVNFFDTADVYSNGLSERILGRALVDLALPRDEVVIATKVFGRVMAPMPENPSDSDRASVERRNQARNVSGLSRKHILSGIDASLQRLGLDHVDLYQVHGTDPLTPIEETVEVLAEVVRSGKARYVGLCNMPAWLIMKAVAYAEARGLPRFESCQMYYSIAGRDLEREVVPMALDQKLAILPWSPLAGGFLSGKFRRDTAGPADSRRAVFDFPPVDQERGYDVIEAMDTIAVARGVSVAQVALAWLLHQPHVTSVIIGAKKLHQLEDNLASVALKLSADELAKLDAVSALPREYPGWMLEFQGSDRRGQVG